MDREKIAGITPEQIRAFRLRAHHLDRKLPPGVLLRGGRVAGVWRQKLQKTSVAVEMTPFEPADAAARERLEAEAAQYAAFRGVSLRACTFRTEA